MYGADNRSPAASPYGLALQASREPIPQARFDHRLLERSPDVLAYADAFSGSTPVLFHDKNTAPHQRGCIFMVRITGVEPAWCYPHGPEPCASANSAISACSLLNISII